MNHVFNIAAAACYLVFVVVGVIALIKACSVVG
jgi:hypothetical protein